jgi:hypothetical protein
VSSFPKIAIRQCKHGCKKRKENGKGKGKEEKIENCARPSGHLKETCKVK